MGLRVVAEGGSMTAEVKVERVMLETEHDNQKWLVLQGSIDGVPAVTKRVSIAVAALVTNPGLLDHARAKLISDVAEYHANYLLLQAL
jgi:acyl CoA:acetate/3-ketoacid CoA transferase beta subunit